MVMLVRPCCKTTPFQGLLVILFAAVGIKAAVPGHLGDFAEDLQGYFGNQEPLDMDSIWNHQAGQGFDDAAYQHSATTSSFNPNPNQMESSVSGSPSEGTSPFQTVLFNSPDFSFKGQGVLCMVKGDRFPTEIFLKGPSVIDGILPIADLYEKERIAKFEKSKNNVYRMLVGDFKQFLQQNRVAPNLVIESKKDYEMVMIYEVYDGGTRRFHYGIPLALPWWSKSSTENLLSDFLRHSNIYELPVLPFGPGNLNLRKNSHEFEQKFQVGGIAFKSYSLMDRRTLWGFSFPNQPELFHLINMDKVYD